ncbi:MAG: hypothetical protein J7L34_01180 [Thermotogaceae bacterium]|nr:hypothetical protein [Thermotogaceae bacterium]
MIFDETAKFNGGGVTRSSAYHPYNKIYYKKLQNFSDVNLHLSRVFKAEATVIFTIIGDCAARVYSSVGAFYLEIVKRRA